MSWIYDGGGDELYQKYFTDILKFKVKGFLCMPMGPEPYGWFSKPVNSVEDLKKMKFRSPPGIPAESFKVLGIPTVSMAGGEIVPSAQRGVIDAAEWISPADDAALGLKHHLETLLHPGPAPGDFDRRHLRQPRLVEQAAQGPPGDLPGRHHEPDHRHHELEREPEQQSPEEVRDRGQGRRARHPGRLLPCLHGGGPAGDRQVCPAGCLLQAGPAVHGRLGEPDRALSVAANGTYATMGKTALDKNIVGYDKK